MRKRNVLKQKGASLITMFNKYRTPIRHKAITGHPFGEQKKKHGMSFIQNSTCPLLKFSVSEMEIGYGSYIQWYHRIKDRH